MTRSGELTVVTRQRNGNVMSLPSQHPSRSHRRPVLPSAGQALATDRAEGISFLSAKGGAGRRALDRGMGRRRDQCKALNPAADLEALLRCRRQCGFGVWRPRPATAEPYDFVSRFFAPHYGVPEDPVTGSAHCALTPFWAKRLDKKTMKARQASPRGGDLLCTDAGARTIIQGDCALYLTGEIESSYWRVFRIAQGLLAVQAFACRRHRRCLRRTCARPSSR